MNHNKDKEITNPLIFKLLNILQIITLMHDDKFVSHWLKISVGPIDKDSTQIS